MLIGVLYWWYWIEGGLVIINIVFFIFNILSISSYLEGGKESIENLIIVEFKRKFKFKYLFLFDIVNIVR